MPAEIPRNQAALKASPTADRLGTLESCSSDQSNMMRKTPMIQSDHQPLNPVHLEELKTPEPRAIPQRAPEESSVQKELLVELQVLQLQKVLQEQNTLLSLFSKGLILSPTFLARWQVQTPPSVSEANLLSSAGNPDAFEGNSSKGSRSAWLENESVAWATNNNSVLRLHRSGDGIWQEADGEDENDRSHQEHGFPELRFVPHRLLFQSFDDADGAVHQNEEGDQNLCEKHNLPQQNDGVEKLTVFIAVTSDKALHHSRDGQNSQQHPDEH
ncbi:hypothetical protein DNTS_002205 [Danionella cerebrum]|uniref:Uncharacterized protein n=1 Tax=Danionella cerebrum TaxID=2873325 RepID=A0A553QAK6_9TELE|nr:hypothetical protein DNTS_002205 [Danionella translucida]